MGFITILTSPHPHFSVASTRQLTPECLQVARTRLHTKSHFLQAGKGYAQ
jgi:hypothetical protein